MKQMLAKERTVSCDWCFHENARGRSVALNLSQLVDLFNQSEWLPEVNIEHDWGRLSQSEASLLSVKIQDDDALWGHAG